MEAIEAPQSFAMTRPVTVGQGHLMVRDLDQMIAFYRDVIGLSVIEKTASGALMGVAGRPLMTLSTAGQIVYAPRNAAGLFHTAFLVPNRQALAHWLAHVAHLGVTLEGASDHDVSEAIYLSDPEGNGIEIYRDRQPDEWRYTADGGVHMDTRRLDLQALYDTAPKTAWSGMAQGTAIGHIHLQVGNVEQADRFYEGVLGLRKMASYPGASFFSSGAYHHHVAANVWNSRNAGVRAKGMTGLARYSLAFKDLAERDRVLQTLEQLEIAVTRTGEGHDFKDPWGIGITLVAESA
ncbi:VOC family protein [Peteryoungia desertarenae]|uniref:VOC family protein n=1 Tax=Peteryoungia desertarenae TaxID=1813451 RepID=A0ABX6QS50_9HYPH|nr:VOC family protein [Peteryoungia desertarenae]